jgi:type IV pilus assembly protein PilA
MLKRLRERAGSESGFTLIELLVVMLILGILAAIAIPAFLNQKNKASDSSAKVTARTMETAVETWSTDHGGVYNSPAPTVSDLNGIENTIPNDASVVSISGVGASAYTVGAKSTNGNWFYIARTGGSFSRTCTIPSTTSDHGGCTVTSGTGGTW